jgi:MFS family permease
MRNIILLGLTSLFTDIASEMVYPLLPFFLTVSLGAGPAVLGLVEGIAESTASLLKVFSGYLSDRFRNRRALTILGYSSSVLGKLLLYMASAWSMVLAGRVVDRVGKGIRTAPRDALIAESAGEGKRGSAFGLHRAMDTIGAAIGVALAYFFVTAYHGEYQTVFLWSMLPAAIGVTFLFFVREPRGVHTSARAIPQLRWRILPGKLKLLLVVAGLFTLANSSNTFLLLRATGVGFSPADAILLYLGYNLAYALFSYPAGRLSDRIGRKTLLVAGYSTYGLVYLLLGTTSSMAAVCAAFALYGVYSAFTEGVEKALVADLAPAGIRATAIGLHATIIGIGLFPASFVAGELWALFGPQATFLFGGAVGLAAAIGLAVLL